MKNLLLDHLVLIENRTREEIVADLYETDDKDKPTDKLLDSAPETLKAWDAARVSKLKGKGGPDKQALADQRSRGKKEGLEELETALRSVHGYEGKEQGADLVAKIVAAAKVPGKSTEDDVKRSEWYLSLERRGEENLKTVNQDWQTKFDLAGAEHKRAGTLTRVQQDALQELDILGAIMPENKTIAGNFRRTFANRFEEHGYEIKPSGLHTVLKDDDTRLEDEHGNAVAFETLVKQFGAEYFEFGKQKKKPGTGNKNDYDKIPDTGAAATSEDEYLEQMAAASDDPKKQKAITEKYEAEVGDLNI